MPNSPKTEILSVASHLPNEIVKSDDLFADIGTDTKYGLPTNWMSNKMGIIERRLAPDNAKPSDLAIPAAIEAVENSNINPDDIELVIFCGIERDLPEPATAHIIQSKVGLKAPYAFDVANACFGFIDAMSIASNFIEKGTVKYALVVTGEVPGKILRTAMSVLKNGVPTKQVRQIIGALSVGDAGGAVILGLAEREGVGFKHVRCETHSHLANLCQYGKNESGDLEGIMKMAQITRAMLEAHNGILEATREKLGWPKFDCLLTHQIGQKPFDRMIAMFDIDQDQAVKTYDTLGNITSATFPVNFHKLSKSAKFRTGMKIGGAFAGSGLVVGQFGYVT